ncbi:hypothetical protein LTR36_005182 [Oleoguttula mirabilis]|uniref:Uncharacterized protein n=1 Tax=Oleoguttula mirabilis TaxID=1507867 RepID=A0AAV9JX22_9PEZI|nr:hypothetical protein LTR36_005182 [Oleoguttula mirabilis]
MASAVTTTSTDHNKCVTAQAQPKPTVSLKRRRSLSSQPGRAEQATRQPEPATRQPDQQIARPYLKLLMPEPADDLPYEIELRRQDCRNNFYRLSSGYRNKNWKTRPVLAFEDEDDQDDQDDAPMSLLANQDQGGIEVKQDAEGTKVMVDGEEMVDMID